ncbi:hypothetical protein EVAR_85757_1 [Eumeta japonica]|uniref:Uncharacterized protein n=1 Tax=Eumeta variegata TaxID=151549 RepID=A0A4C1ZHN8_EUMVA|nr:hypothetical protein EVAR_85757_1 [Eumeta japonica]
MRGADLKVAKPENKMSRVVIRGVLKVNLDEDIVRSLRTQNRHISEGLDLDKERPKLCRRTRNDFECHPVLEYSHCLGFGHGECYCKDVSDKCAHCEETILAQSASPEAQESPRNAKIALRPAGRIPHMERSVRSAVSDISGTR